MNEVKWKREYYESGALGYETPYVNGQEHGLERHYNESGALLWEIPFVNGQPREDLLKDRLSLLALLGLKEIE